MVNKVEKIRKIQTFTQFYLKNNTVYEVKCNLKSINKENAVSITRKNN